MYRRKKRAKPSCCEFACDSPRFCFGRCHEHFAALSSDQYQRLKNLSRAERKVEFQKSIIRPELPHWEYENPQGEQELAQRYGKHQDSKLD